MRDNNNDELERVLSLDEPSREEEVVEKVEGSWSEEDLSVSIITDEELELIGEIEREKALKEKEDKEIARKKQKETSKRRLEQQQRADWEEQNKGIKSEGVSNAGVPLSSGVPLSEGVSNTGIPLSQGISNTGTPLSQGVSNTGIPLSQGIESSGMSRGRDDFDNKAKIQQIESQRRREEFERNRQQQEAMDSSNRRRDEYYGGVSGPIKKQEPLSEGIGLGGKLESTGTPLNSGTTSGYSGGKAPEFEGGGTPLSKGVSSAGIPLSSGVSIKGTPLSSGVSNKGIKSREVQSTRTPLSSGTSRVEQVRNTNTDRIEKSGVSSTTFETKSKLAGGTSSQDSSGVNHNGGVKTKQSSVDRSNEIVSGIKSKGDRVSFGRSSSEFQKPKDGNSSLGNRVIAQRESFAKREGSKASVSIKDETNLKKSIASQDLKTAATTGAKNLALNIGGIATAVVTSGQEDDLYAKDGKKFASQTVEGSRVIISSTTAMVAGRGIPGNMEDLSELLRHERFSKVIDLTHTERLKKLDLLRVEKRTQKEALGELYKKLSAKNGKGTKSIQDLIDKKTKVIARIGSQEADLKLLNKLKGGSGVRGAKLVERKKQIFRNIKRQTILMLKKILQETEDITIQSASRLGGMAVPVLKKGKVVVQYLGRTVLKLVGVPYRGLTNITFVKGIIESKGNQTATRVVKKAANVVRHPIRATAKGATHVVKGGGKLAGRTVVKTVKGLDEANKVKVASKAALKGSRAITAGLRKAGSKLGGSAAGKAFRALKGVVLKTKAAVSAISGLLGVVFATIASILSMFIVILLMLMMASTVMMYDFPEKSVSDLSEVLDGQISEFIEKVVEMKDEEDDRTNVIIHLPDDTSSLDNRREILSMTAVYFEQDFKPTGSFIKKWKDVAIHGGIDNGVISYMTDLMDNSHNITTQSHTVNELRLISLGDYKVNEFDNHKRPLPETMVWKHKSGETYEYEFFDGMVREFKQSWEPLPNYMIPEIDSMPEGVVRQREVDGVLIYEYSVMERVEVESFRMEEITIPEANKNNKENGVVFKKEGDIYVSMEERERPILYKHVYVDVKRFDAIFDLDGAGNLHYTSKLGLVADKIFDHNKHKFNYVNDKGIIEVGVNGWKGNQALNLLKEIYKDNKQEFNTLGSQHPEAWLWVEKDLSSESSSWANLKLADKHEDSKVLIGKLINTTVGTTIQQGKRAEGITATLQALEDKGITDEKTILLFGEIGHRLGVGIYNKAPYSTALKAIEALGVQNYGTSYKIYNDTIAGKVSKEENDRVKNRYKKIDKQKEVGDGFFGSGSKWGYPLEEEARVSSEFGPREEVAGTGNFHYGIDLAVPVNTNIVATLDGKVTASHYTTCGGNRIEVDAGGGKSYRYLHLNKSLVRAGDSVLRGQIIGLSGGEVGKGDTCTGGPHLHAETIIYGSSQNPRQYLDMKGAAPGFGSNTGGIFNNNPDWEGWDEGNRDWAKSLYNSDWADLYGLYDTGTPKDDVGKNFEGYINPAIGDDKISDKDKEKIDGILNALPSGTSSVQRSLVQGLLNGVGSIPYKEGGLPKSAGLNGAKDGLGYAGLVEWAYLNTGSSVRGQLSTQQDIWSASLEMKESEVKIGDISLQSNPSNGLLGNIAIFIGNGKWVSLTNTGLEIATQTYNTNFRTLANFR